MQNILNEYLYPDIINIINSYMLPSIDRIKFNKELINIQIKNKRYFFVDFYCTICHDEDICKCDESLIEAMKSYSASGFKRFFDTYGDTIREIEKMNLT